MSPEFHTQERTTELTCAHARESLSTGMREREQRERAYTRARLNELSFRSRKVLTRGHACPATTARGITKGNARSASVEARSAYRAHEDIDENETCDVQPRISFDADFARLVVRFPGGSYRSLGDGRQRPCSFRGQDRQDR